MSKNLFFLIPLLMYLFCGEGHLFASTSFSFSKQLTSQIANIIPIKGRWVDLNNNKKIEKNELLADLDYTAGIQDSDLLELLYQNISLLNSKDLLSIKQLLYSYKDSKNILAKEYLQKFESYNTKSSENSTNAFRTRGSLASQELDDKLQEIYLLVKKLKKKNLLLYEEKTDLENEILNLKSENNLLKEDFNKVLNHQKKIEKELGALKLSAAMKEAELDTAIKNSEKIKKDALDEIKKIKTEARKQILSSAEIIAEQIRIEAEKEAQDILGAVVKKSKKKKEAAKEKAKKVKDRAEKKAKDVLEEAKKKAESI